MRGGPELGKAGGDEIQLWMGPTGEPVGPWPTMSGAGHRGSMIPSGACYRARITGTEFPRKDRVLPAPLSSTPIESLNDTRAFVAHLVSYAH